MKPKLLYILPTNLEHPGINQKVLGQIKALENNFETKLIFLDYKANTFRLTQILKYIIFEIKAIIATLRHKNIYCRYNPKAPLINFILSKISEKKNISLEHNADYIIELEYLNRNKELSLHKKNITHLKKSNIRHITMIKDLENGLKKLEFKPNYIVNAQNGYLRTKINQKNIDPEVIKEVNRISKTKIKVGIFVGTGKSWHGLDMITDLFKEKNCHLIIINSDKKSSPPYPNMTCFGELSHDTLKEIYAYAHFGIGTFRWDLIGITQGSPLKTREYLAYGLPILVNYEDTCSEYEEIRPYIFNFKKNPNAIKEIIDHSFEKSEIMKAAKTNLNWTKTWLKTLNV